MVNSLSLVDIKNFGLRTGFTVIDVKFWNVEGIFWPVYGKDVVHFLTDTSIVFESSARYAEFVVLEDKRIAVTRPYRRVAVAKSIGRTSETLSR